MSADHAKSIFMDLLDVPEGEHERYIDRACGGDTALADRVRGLIDAHLSADSFLGEIDRPVPADQIEHEQPEIPKTIGPYEVVRPVGEGGFGSVFLCRQTEPIDRLVAVKVLRPGIGSGTALRRFEEERVLLSRMNHPGIARVLDAGRDPRSGSFIAMEYIDGEPITTYCDRHRFALPERFGLMVQACKGVQHAHQKGVLHRDLKPSNVLVCEIDGRPVVKIIDFGVSKAFAEIGDEPAITRTVQLVGTPQYMSPEQASAEPSDADTRSDVYSLGVMLYELASGAQPFDSNKIRSASATQLERMIREIDPPKPSARVAQMAPADAQRAAENQQTGVSQLVRQLRGEVDWIVAMAMSKDRERRYPSAYALGEDVERALRAEPTAARPPSAGYTLRKLIARNRATAAVVAILSVCLIAVACVSIGYANRISQANREIQATLETQERVLAFTEGMLGGINPATARGKDTELFRIILDDARDRVTTEIDDSPAVGVRVRLMIGNLYRNLGEFDTALAMFEEASDLSEASFGDDHAKTLQANSALGAIYAELSRIDDARELLEPTVRIARASLGIDHPDTLVAQANLAAVYGALGDRERSIEVFDELLASRIRVLGDEHEDTMATRNGLANALRAVGQTDRAEAMFRRVLDHQLVDLGPDHPTTLRTRTNLATIYAELERFDEASRMNAEILEQKRQVLGNEHPSVLVSMVNLSRTLEHTGEIDRARGLLEEGYEISDRTLGPAHQYTLTIQNNLAALLTRQEEYAVALPHQIAANTGLAELLGERHPIAIQCAGNLAQGLLRAGRAEEARDVAFANTAIARDVFASPDRRLLDQLQTLAKCYAAVDETTLAADLVTESAEVARTLYGYNSPEHAAALALLEDN